MVYEFDCHRQENTRALWVRRCWQDVALAQSDHFTIQFQFARWPTWQRSDRDDCLFSIPFQVQIFSQEKNPVVVAIAGSQSACAYAFSKRILTTSNGLCWRFLHLAMVLFGHLCSNASKQTWNMCRRIHSERLRNLGPQKTLPESNKYEKLYHRCNWIQFDMSSKYYFINLESIQYECRTARVPFCAGIFRCKRMGEYVRTDLI